MDQEDVECEIDRLKDERWDLEKEIDECQAEIDDMCDPEGRKAEIGRIEHKILDRRDGINDIEEELEEWKKQLKA